MPQLTDFLPTTRKEMELRGWDEVDVVLFSGDAYVDHPSFGAAVIGRILEAEGLRVAIVPQPNWRDDLRDFRKMGRPRLFFETSGRPAGSSRGRLLCHQTFRSAPVGSFAILFSYANNLLSTIVLSADFTVL